MIRIISCTLSATPSRVLATVGTATRLAALLCSDVPQKHSGPHGCRRIYGVLGENERDANRADVGLENIL